MLLCVHVSMCMCGCLGVHAFREGFFVQGKVASWDKMEVQIVKNIRILYCFGL